MGFRVTDCAISISVFMDLFLYMFMKN